MCDLNKQQLQLILLDDMCIELLWFKIYVPTQMNGIVWWKSQICIDNWKQPSIKNVDSTRIEEKSKMVPYGSKSTRVVCIKKSISIFVSFLFYY